MKTILLAVGPLAALALVMGAAILGARIAPRFRDPHRRICVVDMRTYREAASRIDRLAASGGVHDLYVAHAGAASVLMWLNTQKHGRRSTWSRDAAARWRTRHAELGSRLDDGPTA